MAEQQNSTGHLGESASGRWSFWVALVVDRYLEGRRLVGVGQMNVKPKELPSTSLEVPGLSQAKGSTAPLWFFVGNRSIDPDGVAKVETFVCYHRDSFHFDLRVQAEGATTSIVPPNTMHIPTTMDATDCG
jgi:hypothetical protein